MSAIDGKTGKLKDSEEKIAYDIAGPLCFQVSTVNPQLEVDLVLFQIQNSLDLYQSHFKYFQVQRKLLLGGERGYTQDPKNTKKSKF